LGLSQAQFNGLLVLENGQEVLGCELARRMGLSPSRGSRVLNALVTSDYVKTRISPEDRRTVLISLTARGRQMREQILGCAKVCEDRIRESLDRAKVGQIRESLELLATVL
jgi:DNA-binding MarR family transcriptional regulator